MYVPKNNLIQIAIEEVDGKIFPDSKPYSPAAKVFFEDRYAQLLQLLPSMHDNVKGLEVGLAGGVLAISLKRFFKLKELYALEHPVAFSRYTDVFLKIMKKNAIEIKAVDLRTNKYPWNNDFFDFIVMSEVIEHIVPSDIPHIIYEFKRILKKGGFLVVTTPNIASLLKRINLLRQKNPIEFDLDLHEGATFGHIREYTMSETVTILENADFTILKKQYFSIDAKRNVFMQIEANSAKLFPSLGNNLFVLAKK